MAAKKPARANPTSATPAEPNAASGNGVELVVARSNREAMRILAGRIATRAKLMPFERHIVLVDSHAIGRNVVASVAEEAGMAVGIEPVLLQPFLRRIAHGLKTIDGAPTPVPSNEVLSHHMVALAILEVIPTLQKTISNATKGYAAAITSAKDTSTQLALASELARSLDAAIQASVDYSTLEPWVDDLYTALFAHAAALPTGVGRRLGNYLDQWPQIKTDLQKIAAAADLREKLSRRGLLPHHVFAFDLTVYPDTPQALALTLLAQSVPVELVLVDHVVRPSHDAASKAWSVRSRRPIDGIRAAVKAAVPEASEPEGVPKTGLPSLRVMQQSIAGEAIPLRSASKGDRSVSIHHVVSEARAAEIVRDVIHHAFLDSTDLLPEQIAVVSDDPRRDAPSIENAFTLAEATRESLPVTVTGINTRDRDECVDAFLTALRLAPTSFARDAVFQLLSIEPVARGFRLEPDEVEELAKSCKQAGLRSYVDAKHREDAIGVPNQTDHCTWTAALASLAMTMALPDGGHEEVSVAGIVPSGGLQSTDMNQLAALRGVIDLLQQLRRLAAGARLSMMVQTAQDITERLLNRPGRWKASRDNVLKALSDLQADALSAGFDGEVDYFWFLGEISRRLNRVNSGTRVLHGGISLLSPSQARGRTPRIAVFLLSERFPTEDRPLWPNPFHATHWGGPQRQHADLRDVFSVFMNTSDRVVFVVPSMCDRTHERLSMSSVVHDVRTIAESLSGPVTVTEHDDSVIAHSLHSFSHSSRVYGRPLPTRHRGAIRGCIALATAKAKGAMPRPFGIMDLTLPVPTEVTVEQFARFFEKPIEAFMEHHRIFVKDIEDEWRLREAIGPSYLERWKVYDTIYRLAAERRRAGARFANAESDKATSLLRAIGLLRGDRAGRDYLDEQRRAALDIEQALARAAATFVDITVAYTIGGHRHQLRVFGDVPVDANRVVRHALGSMNAKRLLAAAAVQSVCQHAGVAIEWQSHFIKSSDAQTITSADTTNFVRGNPPAGPGQPPLLLPTLARLWHLGHQMPLPLFAEPIKESLAIAPGNPPDIHTAMKAFHQPDQGWGAGQALEATVRSVFRGQEPLTESQCGAAASDFSSLAEFISGLIPDPFPHI
jgi:exonuclease V gamma subunit